MDRLLDYLAEARDPEELFVRVGGILSFPPPNGHYIAATLVLLAMVNRPCTTPPAPSTPTKPGLPSTAAMATPHWPEPTRSKPIYLR